jgi:hypothetical protein
MMPNPSDEDDLYAWACDQVQRHSETLDGIPSGYPRRAEFEVRLIMHRRILEAHKPRTDDHGASVCDNCVRVDPPVPGLPRFIVDCYAPCEHVALVAYQYARCPGFRPEWINDYAWAPGGPR